jgi:hypothetical protein
MTTADAPSYAGYRFPAEIISFAVWLYFRFPLSLRHVDEIVAARGIVVSHETIRHWGLKSGQSFANQIRLLRLHAFVDLFAVIARWPTKIGGTAKPPPLQNGHSGYAARQVVPRPR